MLVSDLVRPRLAAALTEVGRVPAAALTEARLQLHHALQVVAAVGATHVPARDDYSHTTVGWQPVGHWFESGALPGGTLRAGLSLPSITLRLGEDMLRERFELPGRTLAEATAWMHDVVQRHHATEHTALDTLSHDLPAHALVDGGTFEGTTVPARAELGHWFEAADALLEAYGEHEPRASVRRGWPHHFDLATLVDLGEGRSIGVGLSPGDGSYDEPYFYVTPWPYPESGALPPLRGPGHWHTEGFTAAILTASALADLSEASARADALATFVHDATTNLEAVQR